MVYFDQDGLLIRNMVPSDAQILTDEEIAQCGRPTS